MFSFNALAGQTGKKTGFRKRAARKKSIKAGKGVRR